MLTLILGGARSGKSEYATRLAEGTAEDVSYIATAQPLDDEMRARIAAHRQRRPVEWETLEIPLGVGERLSRQRPRGKVIILDCLTLMISNAVLEAAPDADRVDESRVQPAVQREVEALLKVIHEIPAHWIVISNEVGQGLVPPYLLGRVYRDLLGWTNQQFARRADEVIWMVAGIPVPIAQYRDAGEDPQPRTK